MLNDTLLDLDYYLDKLSTYFKSVHGIEEQFSMIHNILVKMNDEIDNTFTCLDVMKPTYMSDLQNLLNTDDNVDILDRIAFIYGVQRVFTSTYYDSISGQTVTYNFELDNYELLTLIRARIIQNCFKGSYEDCMKFYELIGLSDNIVIVNDVNNATCNIFLRPLGSTSISENIQAMFLSGFLTLQSVGIIYNHRNYDIVVYALWDSGKWDTNDNFWY